MKTARKKTAQATVHAAGVPPRRRIIKAAPREKRTYISSLISSRAHNSSAALSCLILVFECNVASAAFIPLSIYDRSSADSLDKILHDRRIFGIVHSKSL
jgi:hypothetical protein